MKAIVTKYHGPTNSRGALVSASDSDGNKVFVIYNDALNSEQNHCDAARVLCHKMSWKGTLIEGSLKGSQHVFVWADVVYADKHLLNGIEVL